MPEGDTVHRAARNMNAALSGRVVIKSDFRVPQLATADLSGRRIIEVVPAGKHMLTRFDENLTLHTHFEMEGEWRIYPSGRRLPRPDQLRVSLHTDEWTAAGYRLPVIEIVRTSEEHRIVGHLGPDILSQSWDVDEAVRRILREPSRSLRAALLDQRNVAGIGNLYCNEVMFLRGLHPRESVGGSGDLARLLQIAKTLMAANLDNPFQTTTGISMKGQDHWVFERPGHPCRRCGQIVRSAEVEGRLAYWCPDCQPERSPQIS